MNRQIELRSTEPAWLKLARTFIGVKEVKGMRHNPMIVQFWKDVKLAGIKDDEVPWCAAFVGAILERADIKSTRSAAARSYTTFGIPLNKPCKGCIVVFWRGDKKGTQGHVAFVTGKNIKGNIVAIGGNQNDSVSEAAFDTTRVLGYRWPRGIAMPNELEELPLVTLASGKLSNNEA